MFELFVDLYRNWSNRSAARKARRDTVNELSKLTAHDLQDIGITRGDIRRLGQEGYDMVLLDMARKTQFGASPVRHPDHNTNLRGWV